MVGCEVFGRPTGHAKRLTRTQQLLHLVRPAAVLPSPPLLGRRPHPLFNGVLHPMLPVSFQLGPNLLLWPTAARQFVPFPKIPVTQVSLCAACATTPPEGAAILGQWEVRRHRRADD